MLVLPDCNLAGVNTVECYKEQCQTGGACVTVEPGQDPGPALLCLVQGVTVKASRAEPIGISVGVGIERN